MNAKSMIRIFLLAVVFAAIAGWAVKEFYPNNKANFKPRPDGVTVINFHGKNRCRTCIHIGKLAQKTIDEEFSAEKKLGKIHWEIVNYDEPAHAHFTKDYSLVSPTVLITLWKEGKEVKWKNLEAVWDHVGDKTAFRAYIAQNVRELLEQP